MTVVLELVLVGGERRRLNLPSHSGELANALDRLDNWIETADGGWVQKQFIVEVRLVDPGDAHTGSDEELADLDAAVGRLTDHSGSDGSS
jgi:hypothetical protein